MTCSGTRSTMIFNLLSTSFSLYFAIFPEKKTDYITKFLLRCILKSIIICFCEKSNYYRLISRFRREFSP